MAAPLLPPGVTVLERGWLSSNNIVLAGDGSGAVLVDTGHVTHAEQTVALVRHALAGEQLARIVNTHLHSDHCGGNAAVRRALGEVPVAVPPGHWDAVDRWDDAELSYVETGQRIERFPVHERLEPGRAFTVSGRTWQVVAAPGHDPHAVMLWAAEDGLLVSADALWGNGFGVVFPELEGEPGFDDVAASLDTIEALAPRVVIPGHGAPFDDVADALARARRRLDGFRADPRRHLHHGMKVLVKYHLMEERSEPLAVFDTWFATTRLAGAVWEALDRPLGDRIAFGRAIAAELVASGALAREGDVLRDA
jgi:glyoxylase-like metal-dependent hydrolase (beta-lactamase superfamily II)